MVIGVGAIGKQVANLLVAMGAPQVCLVDPDKVGEENLAVQGYSPCEIGQDKVTALGKTCKVVNPAVNVILHNRNYGGDIDPMAGGTQENLAIFCCVDSIDVRSFIWKSMFQSTHTKDLDFWVDGRMAAETLRILTWKKGDAKKTYESTLFPGTEAFQAPCTGRSTLYTSYVIAGIMVGEFVKWLRGQKSPSDQLYNMLANELQVSD